MRFIARELAWVAAAALLAVPVLAADEEAREVERVVVESGDDGGRKVVRKRIIVDADGKRRVDTWAGHGSHHHLPAAPGGGGFLGVELTELSPELRAHFGAPADRGVMVARVAPESPAAAAGVAVGDVLVGLDGDPVAGARELAHAVAAREAGAVVALELVRDGVSQELEATLGERPAGPRLARRVEIECEEGDGRCGEGLLEASSFDCGGVEECRVEVRCEAGSCECQVNGAEVACDGLPGLPGAAGG